MLGLFNIHTLKIYQKGINIISRDDNNCHIRDNNNYYYKLF